MPDVPVVAVSAETPAAGRWEPTPIEGVLRTRLTRHADARGSFTELWRASWTEGLADQRFVQANLSRSMAGVLRGLHVHQRQADLWIVVSGRAFVAVVDLRDAVAGTGGPTTLTLDLGPDEAIYIPRLVAHGFLARSDLELVYFVTNEFDSSDEFGFKWDDPTAAVPWPMGAPIVSDRDGAAPELAAVVRELAQEEQRDRA